MSGHGNILRMRVNKRDRLSDAIQRIVVYHELGRGALVLLEAKGVLSPQLKVRLSIEVGFCENILLSIFQLTRASFLEKTEQIRRKPEFEIELAKFCEAVVGEKVGKLLITPSEAEMMELATRNREILKKIQGRRK